MNLSDEELKIIQHARAVVNRKAGQWQLPAFFGLVLLVLSVWIAYQVIEKIDSLDGISEGFAFGFTLCISATTTGIGAAICIGKALVGFADKKVPELLLKLYDESGSDS